MNKIKNITLLAGSLLSTLATAQNRFPKPDFESGYQYPDHYYPVPNETLWTAIDILLLAGMMSVVAWAVLKQRTRKPIIWISILSVAYFGFFRSGCVCSIGAIQNVSLALADPGYVMPVSVLLFFILPILFAFLFGRVFCAGVCPLGALQELVNVKNYRLSKALTTVLGMIPWIYLILAILYAVTRSSFIICRFDPFIGIFRLGGDLGLLIFGVLLLIAAIFTGRPFCRFLCPYGALLSLFSRVLVRKPTLTSHSCINCELCHNACPVDAIMPPYGNQVKESRAEGVRRLIKYFTILPVMIVAGAFLMRAASDELSRGHKDVRLYDRVVEQETNPQDILSIDLEAFYGQGGTIEALTEKVEKIQNDFKQYGTVAGALIGLVIGITLIGLSVKRTRKTYEINEATCVSCARCFSYCPQNNLKITSKQT
ncbi:MAG: 4Fe-4S binding protein [Tannerellaceae bacterium]|nr:4Fe-4S binding protein [Tannerellaceae bacterium]